LVLEYEVIWGHIDILVVVVRRLSRRWKEKILLAGLSPTSPMTAEITISPISNNWELPHLPCGHVKILVLVPSDLA